MFKIKVALESYLTVNDLIIDIVNLWNCNEFIAKQLNFKSKRKTLGMVDRMDRIKKIVENANISISFSFDLVNKELIIEDHTDFDWIIEPKAIRPKNYRKVKFCGGDWMGSNEIIIENISNVFKQLITSNIKDNDILKMEIKDFVKNIWWITLNDNLEINFMKNPNVVLSKHFYHPPCKCEIDTL